ncbi:hypothetical protein GCM10027071_11860 [Microbacterium marinum]
MQIDVDQVGFAALALDDEVVVPDLLGEGTGAVGYGNAHALSFSRKGIKPATNSATGEGSERAPAAAAKEEASDPHEATLPPASHPDLSPPASHNDARVWAPPGAVRG